VQQQPPLGAQTIDTAVLIGLHPIPVTDCLNGGRQAVQPSGAPPLPTPC
jgi:hypothetical protein